MGLPTHWVSAGSGRAVLYWGVYRPLPEHSCTIYCNLSYHRLMSIGRLEAGTATFKAMVGADHPRYTRDNKG